MAMSGKLAGAEQRQQANALATQAKSEMTKSKKSILTDYVNRMGPQIQKALPSIMSTQRFTRITLTAISAQPKLQECTPASFLGAMMVAAQMGLQPNSPLGQCYLIPRWNSKQQATQCQFQLGYKGLIDLAYRSGRVSSIEAHAVHANDEFIYKLGINPTIEHNPVLKDRGDVVAYYAVWHGKDGSYGFDVMSVDDVKQHAKRYSESVKRGYTSPWDLDFDGMAKKTVLKRCLKYAPLATDFSSASVLDETVHNTISDDMSLEPISMDDIISVEPAVTDAEPTESVGTGN